MRVRPMNRFLKWIIPKRFTAITLCPFGIYYRKPMSPEVIEEEYIHWLQQLEMLIIFYPLWYVIEWLIKWIYYKDKKVAYRNLGFEREIKHTDLQNRKWYGWIKYIF